MRVRNFGFLALRGHISGNIPFFLSWREISLLFIPGLGPNHYSLISLALDAVLVRLGNRLLTDHLKVAMVNVEVAMELDCPGLSP